MGDSIPVTTSYEPTQGYPYISDKFKRRDPNVHFYLPIESPASKECTDGNCPLAHTKLEVIFHPIVYKTRKCKMSKAGICVFSQKCSFYNNSAERNAAKALWRSWEERWKFWRVRIEAMLINRNMMTSAMQRSLASVKRHRGGEYKFIERFSSVETQAETVALSDDCILGESANQDQLNENFLNEQFQQYNITPEEESNNSPCEYLLTNIFHEWFNKSGEDGL